MTQQVKILYTNWRGKTGIRNIVPKEIIFSSNEWHKEEQWLLIADDSDKNAERTFAMKDIKAWF
jgi:hypothetical protein